MHRVGDFVDAERIDQQGSRQLPGRPGKAAQDQRAVFIGTAGDEFLGHQVHAVVQRADDAEISQAVQCHHLDRRMLPLDVDDRPPGIGTPTPIDFFDQLVDLGVEQLVLANVGPAGHADLHEHEPFAIFRVFLEETVQRANSLGNAFRVIDPVDADADQFVAQAEELPPVIHLLVHGGAACGRLVLIKVNADGERPHHRRLPAPTDLEALEIHLGLNGAVHGVEKILAVVAQVEAEKIVSQQSAKQCLFPGKRLEDHPVRPGDVPELGND